MNTWHDLISAGECISAALTDFHISNNVLILFNRLQFMRHCHQLNGYLYLVFSWDQCLIPRHANMNTINHAWFFIFLHSEGNWNTFLLHYNLWISSRSIHGVDRLLVFAGNHSLCFCSGFWNNNDCLVFQTSRKPTGSVRRRKPCGNQKADWGRISRQIERRLSKR